MQTSIYCRLLATVHQTLPKLPLILDGKVHLWSISITDQLVHLSAFSSMLNMQECERAARYHFERDRHRFIISRGALRMLLGHYVGCSPHDVVISIGNNKKPFVQNAACSIHYNTSHAGDYIMIVFSEEQIGVDIELINPEFSFEEVIATYFSSAEREEVEKAANPVLKFYLLWTRKEALMKATAKGLTEDLNAVCCLDGIQTVDTAVIGSSNHWEVISFPIEQNYILSVACQQERRMGFYSFGELLSK